MCTNAKSNSTHAVSRSGTCQHWGHKDASVPSLQALSIQGVRQSPGLTTTTCPGGYQQPTEQHQAHSAVSGVPDFTGRWQKVWVGR